YRVLLARFLGAERLGIFQMLFPFYITLVTLTTAGAPVAVSQIVAQDESVAAPLLRHVWRITLQMVSILVLFLLILSAPIAHLLYHDGNLAPLIPWFAPALIMVAVSAVFKGYFTGIQTMSLTALSQITEQIFRTGALALIYFGPARWTSGLRIEWSIWLIGIGEAASTAVLSLGYLRYHPKRPVKALPAAVKKQLHAQFLKLAMPITMSRLFASVITVIEAGLIPWRMVHAGWSEEHAFRYFGQLSGMALPLILFPTTLTFSLSTSLVPVIAEAYGRRNFSRVQHYVTESLKATALFTVPITVVMLIIGLPLDDVVFHTQLTTAVFIPLVLGGAFLYFDMTIS
ncbi:MAG: oligosaccharide flippase family protein, partial [Firmicutes bacterium]|nr:oligosaccharide flippase family protein [Bacillota bacterium]